MKKNFLFYLFATSFLVGCGRNQLEQQQLTQQSASSPQFIVNTPKGKLYRISIYGEYREDRVYFFETNNTVTINIDEREGKKTVVKSIVIIDGVEYIRK